MPTLIEARIADCASCGGSMTVCLMDSGFQTYFRCYKCGEEQDAVTDNAPDLETIYMQFPTYIPVETRFATTH